VGIAFRKPRKIFLFCPKLFASHLTDSYFYDKIKYSLDYRKYKGVISWNIYRAKVILLQQLVDLRFDDTQNGRQPCFALKCVRDHFPKDFFRVFFD